MKKELKHLKTFEQSTDKNLNASDVSDSYFNESLISSIDNFAHSKITNKYLENKKKKLDSMDKKEKILFIEKLISEKKKEQGRNWLYFIIPIIISFFSFGALISSPLLISYFTIRYINSNKSAALDEYKQELQEIEDEFQKEIDSLK
jgi:hypothetical protein